MSWSPTRRACALALSSALIGLPIAGCGSAYDRGAGSAAERPNLLVYVIDTLRADALAPYGNPVVETPAISRLAREGIVYDNAFAASSWTRPSVASILTGLPPNAHGVHTRHDRIAADLSRLPARLREAGYRTGAIITNPNVGAFFGFDRGFDDFIELFEAPDSDLVADDHPRASSARATRRAIEWIDAQPRPWFLFVLTTDPHSPYTPPREFDRYRGKGPFPPRAAGVPLPRYVFAELSRRKYWGEVSANDHSLGELLDHLRDAQRLEHTGIVVTADHGEHFAEHGESTHGKSLYQEVLHVPLILRLPGAEAAGQRIRAPVQLVDLHPTLLGLAGLATDVVADPESSDAAPLPLEEGVLAREVYAQLDLDGLNGEMLYRRPWKLVRPLAKAEGRTGTGLARRLVDLERDPRELRDLRSERPDVEADLEARLDRRAHAPRPRRDAPSAPLELPDDVRRALTHLGYLEAAEPELPETHP